MKYIDTEKLKEYIENKREIVCNGLDWDDMDECQRYAVEYLDDILSFIASLQQEQPDNEDIDKVAQELYEHLYELKRRNNVPTNLYDKQEIIELWKAGIEYGRNHPKHEQPEVDLEKEIKNYLATKCAGDDEPSVSEIARHFYELGLNARKEK